MVDKTLSFVFGHRDFKTIGAGRTDSKVSAHTYVFQLFIDEDVTKESFLKSFNSNSPNDIRALSIESVTLNFNIIQQPTIIQR